MRLSNAVKMINSAEKVYATTKYFKNIDNQIRMVSLNLNYPLIARNFLSPVKGIEE